MLMVYKAEDNFNFFFYSLMSAVFRTSCSIHEKRNVEVELFIQEVIMQWFYWSGTLEIKSGRMWPVN